MEWAYGQWGNNIYNADVLKQHEKEIVKWCEENDISLSAKNKSRLLKIDTWKKQASIIEAATMLMKQIGSMEFTNFNEFKNQIDKTLKKQQAKLSVSEKSQLLNAVSWYDETADKVIKTKSKLTSDQLDKLLNKFRCVKDDLADFGYYATEVENEFTIYETSSDLKDSENIPIKENIHKYFTREVKPHIGEAWIDMTSIKIGFEISFNKYFYRHKPLRTIEEVGAEIVALEKESDGLIAEILGINAGKAQEVIK
jgi:type I restriction enzyme M protein